MTLTVSRITSDGRWYIFVETPLYKGLMLGEYDTERETAVFFSFGDRIDAIKFCADKLGMMPSNAAELRAA
jgi:hypothetical protein